MDHHPKTQICVSLVVGKNDKHIPTILMNPMVESLKNHIKKGKTNTPFLGEIGGSCRLVLWDCDLNSLKTESFMGKESRTIGLMKSTGFPWFPLRSPKIPVKMVPIHLKSQIEPKASQSLHFYTLGKTNIASNGISGNITIFNRKKSSQLCEVYEGVAITLANREFQSNPPQTWWWLKWLFYQDVLHRNLGITSVAAGMGHTVWPRGKASCAATTKFSKQTCLPCCRLYLARQWLSFWLIAAKRPPHPSWNPLLFELVIWASTSWCCRLLHFRTQSKLRLQWEYRAFVRILQRPEFVALICNQY